MDSSSRTDDSSYNYSQEIQNTLQRMETVESGRGTITNQSNLPSQGATGMVDMEKHRHLEKTCFTLQNQVIVNYKT